MTNFIVFSFSSSVVKTSDKIWYSSMTEDFSEEGELNLIFSKRDDKGLYMFWVKKTENNRPTSTIAAVTIRVKIRSS
ncbi:hypothetical protein J14TS2_25630 [Bacillus sp. J14TS2]|nr:hypothetical protein J14TS2_25630 [Bacillus sp. J14TS2]